MKKEVTAANIDKDLQVQKKIFKDDIQFYNISEPPFKIHGVFYENGKYRRLPEELAKNVNDWVYLLHANGSGGRVRFKTNSPYVAISAKMDGIGKMPHFALTGSAGFDLYTKKDGKEKYFGTFIPPYDIEDGYDSILEFDTEELREIVINFPLYSNVCELYIGVSDKAVIAPPDPYRNETPIVYYGHSITQGGCASRPGNAFAPIISRRFDCDFINLGFSGSARGEDNIAHHIAGFDMQLLVYDYDHNAPTVEHLRKTHKRMFGIIREKHPDLPVIMLSTTAMPRFDVAPQERWQVVYDTYQDAIAQGDKNVYYIDGRKVFDECSDDASNQIGYTVEGNHPNDLGFCHLAKILGDKIEEILGDKLNGTEK